jgi:hypothetical protein
MTRLILSLALLCTALIFSASGSIAADWKKTSSCNVLAIGRSDDVSADNVYSFIVDDWKPTVKYIFHGELSWDTNLGNTQGRIILKKKGTSLEQRIADWTNPPGGAEIEQDITKYIDGNGTYVVEWVYMGGKSGVCIMRSEITKEQ